MTAVEDPDITYQAVFLQHQHVLEQDGREERLCSEGSNLLIRLPVYNFELYPDGYFLCGEENCVRIAAELGICDTGTSAYDIVTRAEAADLIYRIMTQEFIIAAPPISSGTPQAVSAVHLLPLAVLCTPLALETAKRPDGIARIS